MSFPCVFQDQASKDKALQNMAALSSAQIVSASVMKSHLPPFPQHPYPPPARVSSGFSFDQLSKRNLQTHIILCFVV